LYRGVECRLSVSSGAAGRALELLREKLEAAGCETGRAGPGALEFTGTRVRFSSGYVAPLLDRAWPFTRCSTRGTLRIEEHEGARRLHCEVYLPGLALGAAAATLALCLSAPFAVPLLGLDAGYAFCIGMVTLFGGWGLFYETPRYRISDEIRKFVLGAICEAERSEEP